MDRRKQLTRRRLLEGAAAVGVLTVAFGLQVRAEARNQGRTEALDSAYGEGGAQYGFMVRVENCIDCERCIEACREHNGTPADVESRRKVTRYVKSGGREVYISTSCMHCAEPSCAAVCPAGAISKVDGGTVVVDHGRCIGCKYCYQACPYGVPHYTSDGMDKCDFCLGSGIELGETPWCAKRCPSSALEFGLLDDLMAKTNGKAHVLEGANGPSMLLR